MNNPDSEPMLEYRRVAAGTGDFYGIRDIYLDSFPTEERVPLDSLLSSPEGGQPDLVAVKFGEEVAGMYCVIRGDGMTFLFYLAVSGDRRDLGLGRRILEHIKEEYQSPILLNIELVPEGAPSTDVRVRRRSFYLRNGFSDTGMVLRDEQGAFNILSDSEADLEEYQRLLDSLGGEPCIIVPIARDRDSCKYP